VGAGAEPLAAAGVVQAGAALSGRLDNWSAPVPRGSVPRKPIGEMTADEIVAEYQTGFFARNFPVCAAVRHLRERGGAIVVIGHRCRTHPTPGKSIVGAVGAGVIVSTKALTKELACWCTRVNALATTFTSDTPSWEGIVEPRVPSDRMCFANSARVFHPGARRPQKCLQAWSGSWCRSMRCWWPVRPST
jgi:3-oxoacyl-[acyl-carrier protein] reductase